MLDCYYNYLDIDRLHTVLEGKVYGRGVGTTVAYMALLLGEAHLGDIGNNYYYFGPTQRYCRQVQYEFADLLQFEDIRFKFKNSYILTEENRRFSFLSYETPDLDNKLRASHPLFFIIDVPGELLFRTAQNCMTYDLIHHLGESI